MLDSGDLPIDRPFDRVGMEVALELVANRLDGFAMVFMSMPAALCSLRIA